MKLQKPMFQIFLILIVIFVIVIGIVLSIVQFGANGIVSELTANQAQMSNRALAHYLRGLQNEALERAEIIANSEWVADGVKRRDYESLAKIVAEWKEGVDFVNIFDSDGMPLVALPSGKSGYAEYQPAANPLLTGGSSSSMEDIPGVGLSIYASAAIYDEDNLIGVVNCIFDLTNSSHMDEFKRQNNCEATIVYGAERINSTILDKQGNRITGTKANPQILETVIDNRTDYSGKDELFGRVYQVYYSPIILNGQAIGMLFTGVDIVSTMESLREMHYLIILVAIIAVGTGGLLIILLIKFSKKFTHTLEELSDKTATLSILESVLNGMDIFLYVTDAETSEILFVNKALEAHLNLTDSVVGEYCWKVFQNGLDKRCDYCSLNKLVDNSNEVVIWEAYNSITGGYYRNIDRLIDWPSGKKVHFCQRIDMTEAKQTQEMLRRMQGIVQSSPNFISYKKLSGECIFINPAASILTGYSHEELMEDYVSLLFDQETADFLNTEVPAAIIEQGILNYEISLKRKDGMERFLSAFSFIIESEEKAFGTIAIDITEKKQFQDKMREAWRKAEYANLSKSNFLSRISHEMRTPMNAIIGMTNLARKEDISEAARDCLDKTNSATSHLLGLIDDVLDMASIEDENLELSESLFKFRDMIDRVNAVMHFKFSESNQSFSVRVDEDVPQMIMADEKRLAQVIVNILNNASKFTPKGGNVSLRVHKTEDNGDRCRLRVEIEDSGIGMPKEEQERLFDAFEQVNNTITRKYGGIGLGLPISKAIVHLMDGDIWIESKPMEGTVFIFSVDVGVGHTEEQEELSDSEEMADLFADKHILLVDDIEINREILMALLDETGVVIDCAENGREAYEKFVDNHGFYDLIFMDIHMPEMDGYEATGAIRKMNNAKAQAIPIIAVTADVFNGVAEKCTMVGMNDYIGKPLDQDIVIAKMKQHLLYANAKKV